MLRCNPRIVLIRRCQGYTGSCNRKGSNHWQELTGGDRALTITAAVLPVVSGPILKGAAKGGKIAVKEAPGAIKKAKDAEKVRNVAETIGKEGNSSDLEGIRIINKKYAGKTIELSGDLGKKYPEGVKFSKEGFPNFEPYSIKKVIVKDLEGDAYYDFIKANEAAGYSSTPKGYTWHHVEDGQTLILVPNDLHGSVRHTGGASLIRKGIRP